jgi:hypothetical protein
MPEDNKKLVITRVSEPIESYRSVGVISDCNYGYVYSYGEDKIEISGLAAGEQVLIFWNYLIAGERPEAEWELSVVDFGAGDACDNALEALPGKNSCDGPSRWYSYTLPKAGNVRLSSQGASFNADTYVEVFDACDGNLIASNDNADDDYYSEVLLENLAQGQTILIRWQTNYPFQVPFDWNLTVEGAVNNAPELGDTFLQILANPTNGQVLGTLQAHDEDGDNLLYRIARGNDDGAFALHAMTGVVTIADASLIPDLGEIREIEVTVTDRVAITTALVTLGIVTSREADPTLILHAYPNPANDRLYLDVSPDIVVHQSYLVNAQGQIIKINDPSTHEISLRDFDAGIYMLKVISSAGATTLKIAVVK